MPKPEAGENRGEFLARCMGDDEAVKDYPDSDQRYAVCNSLFDAERPEAASRMSEAEESGPGYKLRAGAGPLADLLAYLEQLTSEGQSFLVMVSAGAEGRSRNFYVESGDGQLLARLTEEAKATTSAGSSLPEVKEDVSFTSVEGGASSEEVAASWLERRLGRGRGRA